ncbi:MAG: hypothetical protein AAF402_17255, partial [Pseudomonadota bacterium]
AGQRLWPVRALCSKAAETIAGKNPRSEVTGTRRRKHHQYLTRDYGHPELKELLSNAIFMMKACDTYEQFSQLLNRTKPKYGNTIEIPTG